MTSGQVGGLVLAAGAGRRYGGPKALVEYQGRLLVERAVDTARAGGCDPVVVVLGAAAAQVRAESALRGCTVVENPDWATGMGSSLRAGLAALAGTGAVAALVLLVDMPGITPEAVRRVVAHATGTGGTDTGAAGTGGTGVLAMAGYPAGRRGHPVLLGRDHWPGIAELATGDRGARPYLRRHVAQVRVVPCGDVADDRDLDTPDLDIPGQHSG